MITLDGDLALLDVLDGEAGAITVVHDGDYFEGDYIVIPKTTAQMMATRHKLMVQDVEIKPIPYYETSNPSGTTVYIGG